MASFPAIAAMTRTLKGVKPGSVTFALEAGRIYFTDGLRALPWLHEAPRLSFDDV